MHNKTSQEQPIVIPGQCGDIEALIHIPDNAFDCIAVICHPHPLYGGTMHNKVVYMLVKTLQALNMATLRFNFRGVGKSAGHYAHGEGETDDLDSVVHWVKNEYPGILLSLAGFSFGSYIALKAAKKYMLEQLILVAPPVENFPMATLPLPECPVIVVQGDADEIVSSQMVFDWVKTLSPAPTLIRMDGAGHFFHGRLGDLKAEITSVLSKN